MSPFSVWDDIVAWLAHRPIALAFRIIWLCAWLNLGSSRAIYRAMWDANLDLPVLPAARSGAHK